MHQSQGRFDATCKAYQVELALKKFVLRRPLSHSDAQLS